MGLHRITVTFEADDPGSMEELAERLGRLMGDLGHKCHVLMAFDVDDW
jgi:predicted transcriptional regulator